ncbi:pyrroloquinoline quinone-dependent dehydrogenase [Pendulispora brunnea]|uniref:Pyrroloquinoline quinone-dependent dehydrogenase n=1 Tax=Pendulispora brunnea TaxID=2905690 RepID=A0ABZ2KG72_9BACT
MSLRSRLPVGAVPLACVAWLSWSACEPKDTSSAEWRLAAGDGASNKYSTAHQITPDNVKSLEEAWSWTSPDEAIVREINKDGVKIWPHAYETTPLMVGGVLYASTSLSQVAAVDATTGQTLWVYDPKSYLAEDGKSVAFPPNFGFVARGVAYWEDGEDKRIFFGTGNAQLLALDIHGRLISGFGNGGRIDLKQGLRRPAAAKFYSVTSPPMVCGDTVVVGSSILDFPLVPEMPPGDVRGFDARTGQLRWTFHTVPQAGEFGTDTWKNGSWKTFGGANVWQTMSCDPELGNVYLPVSTPANDYYGGARQGDNLFADSVVALNASTGERIWHYQMTHHGLWDYDPPAAPTLVDIRVGGRPVKALAQVSKQGMVFVLDRVTGQPIWPIEERPVPASTVPGEHASPTQPFPTRPAPVDRQGLTEDALIDFTPELRQQALAAVKPYDYGPIYTPPSVDNSLLGGKKGSIALPGNLGGSSWSGAAFHPDKGILFVPSVTRPVTLSLTLFLGAGYAGSVAPITLPNGLPITKPPYGRVTAIDLNTGEHRWQTPIGRGPVDHPALKDLHLSGLGWPRRSFVLATKDLLFVAQEGIVTRRQQQPSTFTSVYEVQNSEAYLWAFDPDRGTMLSETPMAAGNASGSPMTYVANGRQFIVLPVGGGGQPAKLVAFALP